MNKQQTNLPTRNWQTIWTRRVIDKIKRPTAEQLIRLDGFDQGAGRISPDLWKQYVNKITRSAKIRSQDSIFEVGCGSGAFLYPFYLGGHQVGGIDYSPILIRYAQLAMKKQSSNFDVGFANKLNKRKKYDFVISNSVFQYFPTLAYAESVIGQMLAKSNRSCLILDIPDQSKIKQSEKTRAHLVGKDFVKKYADLQHLYYNPDWFRSMGLKYGCRTRIVKQCIPQYGNSQFRFNCFYFHE